MSRRARFAAEIGVISTRPGGVDARANRIGKIMLRVRLAQKPISGIETPGASDGVVGVTGGEENRKVAPERTGLVRQLDSIHAAGKNDVREQHVHTAVASEDAERVGRRWSDR
jgi:hypothetical protein